MSVFVDTSALYALLDHDDESHVAAARAFADELVTERLVTHSYVLVETTALVQRRLGLGVVRDLHDKLVPRLELEWIDEARHRSALARLLASSHRDVSLVDWVSFECMRSVGIRTAFAIDRHFGRHGFDTVPSLPPAA